MSETLQTMNSNNIPQEHAQPNLFSSYSFGDLQLANRMVMAPMTRSRAIKGEVPHPAAAAYYQQRASAGLIITEASQVSAQGVGYIRTPGIHTTAQVAGWKKITEAVHQAGGKIFLQLWHVGRVSHPDFHNGALPVAPSALAFDGEVFTPAGRKKIQTPRALALHEIPAVIEQFKTGAENAKLAGFDGVEIHGANGYLLDQFVRDGSNQRTDAYGGSIANRARFALEVTEAVISVWGAERVGYRISPNGLINGMSDSDPVATFSYLTQALNAFDLGYLHVIEGLSGRMAPAADAIRVVPILRQLFDGAYIVNGGYDADTGLAAIQRGDADLVAFGVPFLANPDLVRRYREQSVLNTPDPMTFYSGEEKGYIDYPSL